MKRYDRQRKITGRKACFLLLLSLGLVMSSFSFPLPLAATGSSVTVKTDSSELDMKSGSLKDFVQMNIDKLAVEPTFMNWKNAQTKYYPLGPGTHSWLVNVMNSDQRIGYLIVTSAADGKYVLSEYGAGLEGLPYSLNELHQFLVQEELISSTFHGTPHITPLYSPLLPLWEVTMDGKKLYINAAVPDILPWSSSKAEAILKKEISTAGLSSSADAIRSPKEVFRTTQSSDPYDNLLWLRNPKLQSLSENDFTDLLEQEGNLVFQSTGKNDLIGAPLMVSGYQIWTINSDALELGSKNVNMLYAAIGPNGKRFVPLSLLNQYGTLQQAVTN